MNRIIPGLCHGTQQDLKGGVSLILAAETLSVEDGCETALYLSDLVRTVSVLGEDSCPGVISITDNKSLFDAGHSTKLTLDRRFRLNILTVGECVNEKKFVFSGLRMVEN